MTNLDKQLDKMVEDGVTFGYSSWTLADDVYHVACPDCGRVILMSKPTTLEKLKQWARGLIK
jgi:hypothetical protein